MEKLNAIVIGGKVYEENHENGSCSLCDLVNECGSDRLDIQFCTAFGADRHNDFSYRYSQTLTDKLNRE